MRVLISAVFIMITQFIANAQSIDVGFLLTPVGSRANGMGDVGAATTPGISATHFNVSKLSFCKNELSLQSSVSYHGLDYLHEFTGYISGFKKIDSSNVVSCSVRYLAADDFYSEYDLSADVSFVHKWNKSFSSAVTSRYINSSWWNAKMVHSYAFDISSYYQHDLVKQRLNLAFGVAISNVGPRLKRSNLYPKTFIPTNFKLGTALSFNRGKKNSFEIGYDANKLLVPSDPIWNINGNVYYPKDHDPDRSALSGMVTSFYDSPHGLKGEINEIRHSFGFEYAHKNKFFFRAGRTYEYLYGAYNSIGFGFRADPLRFDISFRGPLSYSPWQASVSVDL
jgi:hypothetical protein